MSSSLQRPSALDRGSAIPVSSASRRKAARRHLWPTWVMVAASVAGIVVAVFAWNTLAAPTRVLIAAVGYGLTVLIGTAMIFAQRILDVSTARTSGTPLMSSFALGDKAAFGLLILASLANGIVIALQLARQ